MRKMFLILALKKGTLFYNFYGLILGFKQTTFQVSIFSFVCVAQINLSHEYNILMILSKNMLLITRIQSCVGSAGIDINPSLGFVTEKRQKYEDSSRITR